MKIETYHPWDVTPSKAQQIQREMRDRLSLEDSIDLENLHLVAGVDNAYKKGVKETIAFSAVVALGFPDLNVIETHYARQPVTFPYIPGLLSFREAPAALAACHLLEANPDIIIFDAHGYAHPRRFGAASHLGVLLDRPSIGCAKSWLVGQYDEPGPAFGDYALLWDEGEMIGAAVRTRVGHSPLFVSIGHQISLETAIRITLACCRNNHFMPEPTRQAHNLATAYAKLYP
jgi:deoxyribonuclease V